MSEDLNPYNIAQSQFDAAARYVVDLPEGLRNWLRGTSRLVKVEFPVEQDDGRVVTYWDIAHCIRGCAGRARAGFGITRT